MASLLVIRLHPVEPVPADVFTEYLKGFGIIAYEMPFVDPASGKFDYKIGAASSNPRLLQNQFGKILLADRERKFSISGKKGPGTVFTECHRRNAIEIVHKALYT